MKALAEIGYQGYVTMELVPPGADPETYEEFHDMTSFLRNILPFPLKTLKAIEAAL